MTSTISVQAAIDALAPEPLRHLVLLKHLLAYPDQVTVHRAAGAEGAAIMVVLSAAVAPYDREAYPRAAIAALVSSDDPRLTQLLMGALPRGVGIVFKLSGDADLAAVRSQFAVDRRTAFISFSATGTFRPVPDVRVTREPGDAAFRLFETQGHDRAWLEPLLESGKAFAAVLVRDGDPVSACFAFENFGRVWEVGGVVTSPSHRKRGLGASVVRATLAELGSRGLAPRYQAEESNEASIRLAQSVGLAPFLTIVHYVHEC